ncbi:MAG: acyl-CoA dehydrogenase family protein [Oceanococcus sp.]
MIPRTLFSSAHEDFRKTCHRFIAEEIMPKHEEWEERQYVDRAVWEKAGSMGLLCLNIPEQYGGLGADRLYSAVQIEELTKAGASGIGWPVHSDIVAPYILNYGSEQQKQHWLPKMAAGTVIGSIAMTEPGTGSDLQAIQTRAVEDGDDFIINGSKIFITNGYLSDMCIVACKVGEEDKGAGSVTLIIVEADRQGFSKAKPLKKIGLHAQDTCELFFQDVRVPKSNVLGGVEGQGKGFLMLMKELAWERMIIAIMAQATAQATFDSTVEYVKTRRAFGKPVAAFQNTRFKLAEMKTEIGVGQSFVDECLKLVVDNKLSVEAAAAAKMWSSDMVSRVVDECLQLHGGYGYMLEYPVAKAYIDSRAMRIFGGTNEIMKELISRTL